MKSELTGLAKFIDAMEKEHLLNLMVPPDTRRWVSKDEVLHLARRLAAEEKSGDEGLREDKKEMGVWCPTCYEAIKSSERRPDGDSICVNGHKHKTGEFLVGYAPSHLTPKEAPAPSRTAELVKRLRAHINEEVSGGDMPPWMAQDIDEILADFEEGV